MLKPKQFIISAHAKMSADNSHLELVRSLDLKHTLQKSMHTKPDNNFKADSSDRRNTGNLGSNSGGNDVGTNYPHGDTGKTVLFRNK